MRYVSWNCFFGLEVLNFKSKTIERWDLCFSEIFSRKGFQFHYKGPTILGHKSLSLVKLSFVLSIVNSIYIIYLPLHA